MTDKDSPPRVEAPEKFPRILMLRSQEPPRLLVSSVENLDCLALGLHGFMTIAEHDALRASDAAEIKKLTALANGNADSCDALAQEIERLRDQLATEKQIRADAELAAYVVQGELSRAVRIKEQKIEEIEKLRHELRCSLDMQNEYKTDAEYRRIGRDNLNADIATERQARADAEAKIEALKEALKLYAEASYNGVIEPALCFDKGDKARAALFKLEKKSPQAPVGSTVCQHGGEPMFCEICQEEK